MKFFNPSLFFLFLTGWSLPYIMFKAVDNNVAAMGFWIVVGLVSLTGYCIFKFRDLENKN